jgi:signal recognition particle subunit SRP54
MAGLPGARSTAAPPAALMLVGLQGSGKTTTAGKLALYLRKQGRTPYLVPADVQRPAAIDQLKILGRQIQVPVYDTKPEQDPVTIARYADIYPLFQDTYRGLEPIYARISES